MRAVIGGRRQRRIGVFRVDGLRLAAGVAEERSARCRGAVELRVQHTVERTLQLSGDLGKDVAPHGMQAIAARSDRDPPLSQRPFLVRLRSILIEVHRPHHRDRAEILRTGRRAGIRPLTPRGRAYLLIGSQDRSGSGTAREQRPGNRDHPVDADVDGGERLTHLRQRRREHLAGRERHRAHHRTRGLHQITCALLRGSGHALNEFARRSAPEAGRHPIRVQTHIGPVAHLDVASTSSASPARTTATHRHQLEHVGFR